MWTDNETNRDFLNFSCVAETAAEIVVRAAGQPLSMGVSGGWGAGKSSMLNLIEDSLKARDDEKFLYVRFNAWLYQGYDDARAALMEVIASELVERAKGDENLLAKAQALLGRVNWLRVAGLTAGSAIALAAGVPPMGLMGAAFSAFRGLTDGQVNADDIETAEKAWKAIAKVAPSLARNREEESPPQLIEQLRSQFSETLADMDVTLVVFIDDLDRCLPQTAVATLEAIRLFLFMPKTAFVIAADERMIRHAVRAHFKGVDLGDDLVTNYFDKLVQIPLRVPPLGTQDVRTYLFMLFVENSSLANETREEIRLGFCKQLSESWRGNRVDLKYALSLIEECPDDLRVNLELADRIAPLMTTAKQIAGNPRLIKRFLNTLAIRLSIARVHHVTVDEAALAKMILFERCGSKEAHSGLVAAINDAAGGKPEFLQEWEEAARAGEKVEDLPKEWDSDFARDWFALPPALASMDLRPIVYVSREHLPIITAADRLSSEAANLLEAILELNRPNQLLTDQIRALSGRDLGLLMDRVVVRARQVQDWGTPPVLWAFISIVDADPEQCGRVERFLKGVPAERIQADIVPVLAEKQWAKPILDAWKESPDLSEVVVRAIEQLES
jgi:predicted KAP-like P-loop ATPase